MAPLLAVRPTAIAEAQRLCPALQRAELVHLHDDVWLDVLTWDRPDGMDQLMARADEFDALHAMHGLIGEVESMEVGEIRHSTSWTDAPR